ncbi:MAG: hypothetical protein J0L93_05290 [Deltaproteobacteria bacterium]|nr:hypothetical protein [Deltaproteobacteria bacterium]
MRSHKTILLALGLILIQSVSINSTSAEAVHKPDCGDKAWHRAPYQDPCGDIVKALHELRNRARDLLNKLTSDEEKLAYIEAEIVRLMQQSYTNHPDGTPLSGSELDALNQQIEMYINLRYEILDQIGRDHAAISENDAYIQDGKRLLSTCRKLNGGPINIACVMPEPDEI